MPSNTKKNTLIALDYDGTITVNIPFWIDFIKRAETAGMSVVIVTMRTPEEKATMDERVLDACPWIVPTSRQAKRDYCAAYGIHPDIWIDDNPAWIFMDAADRAPQQAVNTAQSDLKQELAQQ